MSSSPSIKVGFKDKTPSVDNALTYPIDGKFAVSAGKFDVKSTATIFFSSSKK